MSKASVSVRIENVTKIFKDLRGKADVVAVNDANFEIEPGELVTLLGPSGCGKTTTLRMIGGFELPTKGRIFLRAGSFWETKISPFSLQTRETRRPFSRATGSSRT